MTSFLAGREAEQTAANYLEGLGYEVIERNWRTRWCEIDIVAYKDDCISFVEVKYRKNTFQGGGLEYVTAKKLQQMGFAAEFWMANHRQANQYQLAAIEVTGPGYIVNEFISSLES